MNMLLALSVLAIAAFVATAIRTVKTKISNNKKYHVISFTIKVRKGGTKKGMAKPYNAGVRDPHYYMDVHNEELRRLGFTVRHIRA